MWLAEVRLRDFRNYPSADLALGRGATVLIGANAQGKSNFLEAVYTAALGRSPRAGRDAELIRFGPPQEEGAGNAGCAVRTRSLACS